MSESSDNEYINRALDEVDEEYLDLLIVIAQARKRAMSSEGDEIMLTQIRERTKYRGLDEESRILDLKWLLDYVEKKR